MTLSPAKCGASSLAARLLLLQHGIDHLHDEALLCLARRKSALGLYIIWDETTVPKASRLFDRLSSEIESSVDYGKHTLGIPRSLRRHSISTPYVNDSAPSPPRVVPA